MTPTEHQTSTQRTLELMAQDPLKAVCAAPGPFITVFLPAYHPGTPDLPRAERMKTILRDAAKELKRRRFLGPVGHLLKPLEELAEDPASLTGGSDSVVFVSPGSFRHFGLFEPTHAALIVASHPHITPILSHLMSQPEFYVLAITKKHLRLGRWRAGQCAEVPLPPGVPTSFEEAVVFEQPDHDRQSRSPSSASSPQVGSTRFGAGSERDVVHERLHQYFHVVDRELNGLFEGAPVVLVGVAQEMDVYRSVSKYPHILAAKPTSPEYLTWAELGERGQEAVLEAQRGEAEKVLSELRESNRRDHVISGIREVLEAAHEGRVHKLLLEKNAQQDGSLGPSFPMDPTRLEGEQDLINAAAVETIRGHGEVYLFDRNKLDRFSPIAAVLRYSKGA
jgi:Bacterial archaeo-eukaryotic release factor family 3